MNLKLTKAVPLVFPWRITGIEKFVSFSALLNAAAESLNTPGVGGAVAVTVAHKEKGPELLFESVAIAVTIVPTGSDTGSVAANGPCHFEPAKAPAQPTHA